MSNEIADEGNYKGHRVVVLAIRLSPGAAWTLSVDISNVQTGEAYPNIEDHDNSYETSDEAIRAGWKIARELIDSSAR